jgi:polysaccharide export outer membrane protein
LDVIYVDVFNVDALSRELQVDASGRISIPLIGSIDAGGKTREELADLIASSLRDRYVRDRK